MPDQSLNNNGSQIYAFPNPMASAEEKATKEYGLAYAKALYNQYVSDNSLFVERMSKYRLARKYAEGQQSMDKYKDLMGLKDGETSYLNLDFTPVPVIPKFLDIKIGQLLNQSYRYTCTPLNGTAKTEEDDKMGELFTNMFLKNSGVADALEGMTGVPVVPKNSYIPKDDDDAKIHMAMNFKNAVAMDMEEALEFVMYNNNWRNIERKLVRDAIVLKLECGRTKIKSNGDIAIEYLDPVRMVIPYNQNDDFSSIPHAGYIPEITIQDLAIQAPELTDKELYDIAKLYAGSKYGNPEWNTSWNWSDTYYPMAVLFRTRPYDNFKIRILDFEFLTIVNNKWLETKKNGKTFLDKKKSTYELDRDKSKNQKELIEKRVKVRYQGVWVVGSEYMYGYKMAENMQFPKKNGVYMPETSLSFKIRMPNAYEMVNQSLVQRMIPFADQIQLCHLKMQQILGAIKPIGVAIDISGLENVMKAMGNSEAIKPQDLTKMYLQTGSYVFSSQRPDGSIINGKPIEQLQNGVRGEIEAIIAAYNYNLNMIRDVTGINEVVDASAPASGALNGTSQLAVQASNNATKELLECHLDLVEDIAKDVALKIQDVLENEGEISGFYKSIGESAVKTIKLSKENGRNIPLNEWGIKIQLLPDEYERQSLQAKVNLALQTQTLRLEDAIMVEEIMKSNVKLAAQYLILRTKKYQEEKQQESMMLQQQNAEVQSQSAEAATQAQMQADQQLNQDKAAMLQLEYKLKGDLSAQEHQQTLEEIALKNQGSVKVAEKSHEGKLGIEAFKSATSIPSVTAP